MRIACLGWGSLVWRPEALPVIGQWYEDGPLLSVEFARQSNNGRITLVVLDQAPPCQVLWAKLDVPDLDTARESLRVREGTTNPNIAHWSRSSGQSNRGETQVIESWAAQRQDIEAVVWTALGPKFENVDGRVPTEAEVVSYLRTLKGDRLADAREYIRRAPVQIQTPYRTAIERELEWTPLQPAGT